MEDAHRAAAGIRSCTVGDERIVYTAHAESPSRQVAELRRCTGIPKAPRVVAIASKN